MLNFIVFLLGIVALVKGSFRIGARQLSQQQGRLIGLILVSPFIFVMCMTVYLVFSRVDPAIFQGAENVDLSMLMESPVIMEIVAQMWLVELVAILVALGAVVFIVAGVPPSEGTPNAVGDKAKRINPFDAPETTTPRTTRSHPLDREAPEMPMRDTRPTPPARPTPAAVSTAAPPDLMTVEQAAAYVNMTPEQILELINDSKLGAVRSRGSYIIARSALDDYVGRG